MLKEFGYQRDRAVPNNIIVELKSVNNWRHLLYDGFIFSDVLSPKKGIKTS